MPGSCAPCPPPSPPRPSREAPGWSGWPRARTTSTFPAHRARSAPASCSPGSPAERNGIEDLRLVEVEYADGRRSYLGTYTAFDGETVAPHLVATDDFRSFRMSRLRAVPVRRTRAWRSSRAGSAAGHWRSHAGTGRATRWRDRPTLRHWEDLGTLSAPERAVGDRPAGNCGSPARDPRRMARPDARCRTRAPVQHRRDAPGPRRPASASLGAYAEPLLTPARRRTRRVRAQRRLLLRRSPARRHAGPAVRLQRRSHPGGARRHATAAVVDHRGPVSRAPSQASPRRSPPPPL